jgi:hypothetical protein
LVVVAHSNPIHFGDRVAAEDEEKTGLLRRLVPGAAERLLLFQADLFDAATFAPAIAGCQFVFLVATPYGLEAAGSKVEYRTSVRSPSFQTKISTWISEGIKGSCAAGSTRARLKLQWPRCE